MRQATWRRTVVAAGFSGGTGNPSDGSAHREICSQKPASIAAQQVISAAELAPQYLRNKVALTLTEQRARRAERN